MLRGLVLLLAVGCCGLSAGLLFGYVVSVNPGLGRLSDREYLAAMQSINRAILNPLFFAVYFGAVLALGAATGVSFASERSKSWSWFLASSALYLVGVVGVTIARNVPLNNRLEGVDVAALEDPTAHDERAAFEPAWNRWHGVRTACSIAAFALCVVAAMIDRQ